MALNVVSGLWCLENHHSCALGEPLWLPGEPFAAQQSRSGSTPPPLFHPDIPGELLPPCYGCLLRVFVVC